jgi:hypothetical protein
MVSLSSNKKKGKGTINQHKILMSGHVKINALWGLCHGSGSQVIGPSLQRPGFNPRAVNVGSMEDKVALGKAFLVYFGFSLSA